MDARRVYRQKQMSWFINIAVATLQRSKPMRHELLEINKDLNYFLGWVLILAPKVSGVKWGHCSIGWLGWRLCARESAH